MRPGLHSAASGAKAGESGDSICLRSRHKLRSRPRFGHLPQVAEFTMDGTDVTTVVAHPDQERSASPLARHIPRSLLSSCIPRDLQRDRTAMSQNCILIRCEISNTRGREMKHLSRRSWSGFGYFSGIAAYDYQGDLSSSKLHSHLGHGMENRLLLIGHGMRMAALGDIVDAHALNAQTSRCDCRLFDSACPAGNKRGRSEASTRRSGRQSGMSCHPKAHRKRVCLTSHVLASEGQDIKVTIMVLLPPIQDRTIRQAVAP
jgi:hypothetical protein